ncbi:hypothetical protein SCLARK_001687 [Spiroplasma clarkii]|uniref:Acetyltransferase n=1 Tax=Spiroplasma clarkii TaxID=2139 RepID=A0A1Y0L2B3_9MOLU|nr:acetyltransferase [Spiroplasma clarkii]ARU92151.1 hypothetical protein SCLARK_001687 [Spiroplasma clarkii]ATX71483.1 hypothetical protein SCLAR_v1c11830 [Spiroplasma clarkii]
MAKPSKETDYKENKPKKGLFQKLFNSKAGRNEVLKVLKQKNIKDLYFYTDINNVMLILENGIRLVKDQRLTKAEEYTVWTYLENKNSIGLEMDNSVRAHFWKWVSEAKINVEMISVIGINPEKLDKLTKQDWAYDAKDNLVYIYETIPVEAISFIMVKDKTNLKRIQTYVEAQDIAIDVYFGETGNIKNVTKGEK